MQCSTPSVRLGWPLCLALATAAGLCGCGPDAITPGAPPPVIARDSSAPTQAVERGSGTTLEPPDTRGTLERRMPPRTASRIQARVTPRPVSFRGGHPHRGRGRGGHKPALIVVELALEEQQ